MLVKWILLSFGIAAVALFALGKVLAFLNPPRPGRPAPPALRRVERALRWTVLVPLAVAVAMLALALVTAP
jgi:hypothetical protein